MTTKDLEGRFGSKVKFDSWQKKKRKKVKPPRFVRYLLSRRVILRAILQMTFERVCSIDVVLLEVSVDDSCTVSMGIVILKNKTSTHTPSKRDDKGCRYIALIVLPSDLSLHNMESVSHIVSYNRSTANFVMKSHFAIARPNRACQGSLKVNRDSSENMTHDQRRIPHTNYFCGQCDDISR